MNQFKVSEIREKIDYTLLNPNANLEAVEDFFKKTRKFGFKRIFISPYLVEVAAKELTGVTIGTTAGFPLGTETIRAKRLSAEISIENGADEIDFVMNIGKALDRDFEYLEKEFKEMAALKEVRGDSKFNVKVILETCFLSPEIIREVVLLAADCGVDFVKTSTGFGPKGASKEDIVLMKEAAQGRIGIKASGGIRTLDQVIEFLRAGADRIGTSSGDQILLEAAAVLPD